jgi:hypothetical protein
MDETQGSRIRVMKDGPYLVSGGVPIARQTIVTDEKGESVAASSYVAREAVSVPSKPMPACEPSQYGFDSDAPHRHSAHEGRTGSRSPSRHATLSPFSSVTIVCRAMGTPPETR